MKKISSKPLVYLVLYSAYNAPVTVFINDINSTSHVEERDLLESFYIQPDQRFVPLSQHTNVMNQSEDNKSIVQPWENESNDLSVSDIRHMIDNEILNLTHHHGKIKSLS